MRGIIKFAGIAALGWVGVTGLASATAVTCGDETLGDRYVEVDPGLEDGFCYAQNGNIKGDDVSGISGLADAQLIDKNGIAGEINYPAGATSGEWSFAAALWEEFDRIFLGFHFGGGGECSDKKNDPQGPPGPGCAVDPDSFIVELAFGDSSGTWALLGGELNGLSNIYLFGICTAGEGNCRPPLDVPEPGTLGLLGLGLAGLGFGFRRRRKI